MLNVLKNPPVVEILFCLSLKRSLGKWRTTTDLRAINKVILPAGSLQPGILLLSLLPKVWPIVVMGLKEFFFFYYTRTG